VLDDVVSIELRAVAGATYALINPSFTPDAAVMQLTGGGQLLGFQRLGSW